MTDKPLYYLGNEKLKAAGVKIPFTQFQASEYLKCAEDPIYFIENYVKIVNLDGGLVLMKLHPFQKEVIRTYQNERKVIQLAPRQTGKTTTMAAFICWYVLFHPYHRVAILANKAATARVTLARIQLMIENLPYWLQQGIVTWNKGDIKLENESTVFTAATSASGIRGNSCVTGDTMVVCRTRNNVIFSSRIDKISLDNKERFEVLTPTGWRDFYGVRVSENRQTIKLIFGTQQKIVGTPCHRFKMVDGSWIASSDLVIGSEIQGICGPVKIVDIQPTDKLETVYDLIEVSGGNQYYTNGVISHNCNLLFIDEAAIIPGKIAEDFYTAVYPTISSSKTSKIVMASTPLGFNFFHRMWTEAVNGVNGYKTIHTKWYEVPDRDDAWFENEKKSLPPQKFAQEVLCSFLGSSNTLLSSEKIAALVPQKPIKETATLKIYEEPRKDRTYYATVDVAEGKEKDNSIVNVLDITEFPFRQVAVYRDNTIAPSAFPFVIDRIMKEYHDPLLQIENNSVGGQVLDAMNYDIEYENLFSIEPKELGVRTTPKTKRIGCFALKSLIENDKLIINDSDTINELVNFISVNGTFKADSGYKDDSVMSLVNFAYVSTLTFFKDLTDKDYAKTMKESGEWNDLLPPLGFFDDGLGSADDDFPGLPPTVGRGW